jgi:hypothetical protein
VLKQPVVAMALPKSPATVMEEEDSAEAKGSAEAGSEEAGKQPVALRANPRVAAAVKVEEDSAKVAEVTEEGGMVAAAKGSATAEEGSAEADAAMEEEGGKVAVRARRRVAAAVKVVEGSVAEAEAKDSRLSCSAQPSRVSSTQSLSHIAPTSPLLSTTPSLPIRLGEASDPRATVGLWGASSYVTRCNEPQVGGGAHPSRSSPPY